MKKERVLILTAMAEVLAARSITDTPIFHVPDPEPEPYQSYKGWPSTPVANGELPDRGVNPHNLPEWNIDGVIVYAATRKAALRKASKVKQLY